MRACYSITFEWLIEGLNVIRFHHTNERINLMPYHRDITFEVNTYNWLPFVIRTYFHVAVFSICFHFYLVCFGANSGCVGKWQIQAEIHIDEIMLIFFGHKLCTLITNN